VKSKLHKDKFLRNHDAIQTATKKELNVGLLDHPTHGSLEAKIHSRILSSKILATSVVYVTENIRSCIGEITPEIEDEDNHAKSSEPLSKVRKMSTEEAQDAATGSSDIDGFRADLEPEQSEDGWESGTVADEDELNDAGWESGSVEEHSLSSDKEQNEANTSPAKTHAPSHKAAEIPSKVAGQSMFLPSLSVGFVRGSPDDSDWSDKDSDAGDVAPKKNRRGQRARRA
jgi:hypothetical protein